MATTGVGDATGPGATVGKGGFASRLPDEGRPRTVGMTTRPSPRAPGRTVPVRRVRPRAPTTLTPFTSPLSSRQTSRAPEPWRSRSVAVSPSRSAKRSPRPRAKRA